MLIVNLPTFGLICLEVRSYGHNIGFYLSDPQANLSEEMYLKKNLYKSKEAPSCRRA